MLNTTFCSRLDLIPPYRALLRGVDFRHLGHLIEEVPFDVVEKEILSVWVGKIQPIVIDYLRLLLQPGAPTWLTDFCSNSLS